MTPPPLPDPSAPATPVAARTCSLAWVSLVLGFLGILIVPALAGLVCGIVALSRIRRSAGALKGKGLAMAGVVTSGAMLLLVPVLVLVVVVFPSMNQGRQRAEGRRGTSLCRELCLGAILYSEDHGGVLPEAASWSDDLLVYTGTREPFLARGSVDTSAGLYGYNAAVAGKRIEQVSPDTVLFFELEQRGWNVSGGPERMRQPTRSTQVLVVGFVDGHAEERSGEALRNLRWNP